MNKVFYSRVESANKSSQFNGIVKSVFLANGIYLEMNNLHKLYSTNNSEDDNSLDIQIDVTCTLINYFK